MKLRNSVIAMLALAIVMLSVSSPVVFLAFAGMYLGSPDADLAFAAPFLAIMIAATYVIFNVVRLELRLVYAQGVADGRRGREKKS